MDKNTEKEIYGCKRCGRIRDWEEAPNCNCGFKNE
jgi:hypothetical protein|tara:strand:- start:751 stop:855 length:105 start_codon:yes stop_codon:yes gene_type:complete